MYNLYIINEISNGFYVNFLDEKGLWIILCGILIIVSIILLIEIINYLDTDSLLNRQNTVNVHNTRSFMNRDRTLSLKIQAQMAYMKRTGIIKDYASFDENHPGHLNLVLQTRLHDIIMRDPYVAALWTKWSRLTTVNGITTRRVYTTRYGNQMFVADQEILDAVFMAEHRGQ